MSFSSETSSLSSLDPELEYSTNELIIDDCSVYSSDEEPTSNTLVFRAELEFLVQTSGEAGLHLLTKPERYVSHCSPSKDPRAHYIQFRIVQGLREAGLFSLAESLDEETRKLRRDYDAYQKGHIDHNTLFEGGMWRVDMDEEDCTLPENNSPEYAEYSQTWKLVRIRSPFLSPTTTDLAKFTTVIKVLENMDHLVTALNHTPRLRIEVRPEVSGLTITQIKKIIAFLWTASPRIDQLHAEYCGPGSLLHPGLEFAQLFNPLPRIHLSDTEWRGVPAETAFTHGPLAPTTISLLKPRAASRERACSRLAVHRLSFLEDEMSILDAVSIVSARDMDGSVRTLHGSYDFSNLIDRDVSERTILFSQHAGTLDTSAMENWIKVCHGLIDFCLNASADRMSHVLSQMKRPLTTSPDSYTVYDLLQDIDLPAQAVHYHSLGPHPFTPDLERYRVKPAVNLTDTPSMSPYSFGIELEFLLPYSRPDGANPNPNDPRWFFVHKPNPDQPSERDNARDHSRGANYRHLAEILNEAGHLSADIKDIFHALQETSSKHPDALRAVAHNAGLRFHPVGKTDCRYQTWCIQADCSLAEFHGGMAGYSGGKAGVEISSPILRNQPADFDRITDVLRIIRGQMRPALDPSCGLHVHVGNVRNFSLRSLKRFATLAWAVDPILFTLVHPSRRDNDFTVSLRTGSMLGTESLNNLPPYKSIGDTLEEKFLVTEIEAHIPMGTLPDRLRREFYRIWAAGSDRCLKNLFGSDCEGRAAVSLERLNQIYPAYWDRSTRTIGGTIEFRCLEGTLDPVLIGRWVKLLVGIVETAESSEPYDFFKIMSKVLRKEDDDEKRLATLLEVIGQEDALAFWLDVVAKNKSLGEGFVVEHGRNHFRWKGRAWHEQNTVFLPKLT